MYSRKIDLCPEKIVSHGKANFGNFNDVSKKISISGMRAPYAGIPLPAFISKLRIKSKIDFVFNLDSFIGFTRFFDLKLIGLEYKEIASLLDKSYKSVDSALQRIKGKVKKVLDEYHDN
jgi:hypothetical protein